jgi:ubiquinone biosynthesis protein
MAETAEPPPATERARPRFETAAVRPPAGTVRRFLTTHRHFAGLVLGGYAAWVRGVSQGKGRRPRAFAVHRILAAVARRIVDRDLADAPFPVQLRRRLELLGPTYVKLGQILSLREDLLPPSVTEELKLLLDRLPAVPFEALVERIEKGLGRPVSEAFRWIDPEPLGSASIAQVHRATTAEGIDVILKVVKPGIPETIRRDARLLRLLGRGLNLVLGRYQPRRIVDEFCEYTLREVDLRREADNAETFASNFRDMPEVVFPKVHRAYSCETVLCMQPLEGIRPDTEEARALAPEDRDRLVDLGAASIVRMFYRDGFFHADLHPGNLVILPGPRVGFIDLGMVGRFDGELKRTLLYYYYCLVMGDAENAARYLAALAEPGRHGNPSGFRREVEEIARRWRRHATFEDFSLGRLILESLARGGHYRMYFPVEMVLMVKALVTFEGVGHLLRPGFDVAEVSRPHIQRIFLSQFSPLRLVREGLRGVPELMDALVKAPLLVTEGIQVLEKSIRRPPESPLTGVRATLLAGFCVVAGALLASSGAPWPFWSAFFALAVLLAWRRGP